MKKGNWKALLPIAVFLVALLVACLQNPTLKFHDKLAVMARGVGDINIITMVLIFMTAGIFVGVAGRSSAESVAYFLLSVIPARFAVIVLFIVSCFVSLSMGTSVGTITLIAPIAVAVSNGSGFAASLCPGAVVGGAMFGDNLSFISDTTIAACTGQGCKMKDKFQANFGIAFPAAIISLAVILARTMGADMGSGASSMYETTMVAILVSAICALIREYGGFDALLYFIRRVFKNRKGGKLGINLLVGAMDIAAANNTIAIVLANPIAREMSREYNISPKQTASIPDTFSCIFQGIIPYGAQMLVAVSAAAELECQVSSFDILPGLTYPYVLLICSLVCIFLIPEKKQPKA